MEREHARVHQSAQANVFFLLSLTNIATISLDNCVSRGMRLSTEHDYRSYVQCMTISCIENSLGLSSPQGTAD
jgi:hypothetical protein